MKPPAPQVRISVALARQSDVAVIFRRGPSKQVLLIRWHRGTDSFYFGQWFKGRIYSLRCDLSPSGDRLVYFAADYKAPYFSWTAVSRPPFLTALALWPKGDCWGGGGQFETENRIALNHRSAEMKLADLRPFYSRLPRAVKIAPFGAHSGWGEDSPLHEALLVRNGWKLTSAGKAIEHSFSAPLWFTFDPPQIWSKPNPRDKTLVLHSLLLGINKREGPWRVLDHSVVLGATRVVHLERSDWADWDSNGDLLYAANGCLFRRTLEASRLGNARLLLDTAPLRFRELAPPEEARTWSDPLVLHADGWGSA